jgi:phenylacetate-coenzyme A ligase PaaK-like adenylate-forming protein
VPPGTPSASVLLTNLANRVQPLIRYDLGDRVTLAAGPCACGSALPVIEVQGRSGDLLALQGDRGAAVRLLPLALSTVLENEAGLFDFQLEQRNARELVLRTHQRGEAAAQALQRGRHALLRYLQAEGAAQVRIELEPGPPLCSPRSGKVQRIVARH